MFDDEVNESKESDSQESDSQPDTSGKTDWEQERMDTLAGFENKTPATPTQEAAANSESLLPEEDPHSLRTEQSFQNHPFSKLGLVSISTLILLATTGAFLSANLMQSSEQKPREQQVDPTAKKEEQPETDATDNQGRVLTDLALTTQGKDLEALNEGDKQQPKPEQSAKVSKSTTTKVSTEPVRTTYAPAARPRPVPTYSPTRPVTAYVPPRAYAPPQIIPKPVAQPSPEIQRRSVEPLPAEEVNPMERWIAAAQLGSYGQVSAVKEPEAEIASNQTAVEYATLTVPTKSKQQAPQTLEVNFDEETPILHEQPRQLLMPGTGAKAVLATPFAWDGSEDKFSDRLSVVLAEPLLAADNSVALPAKTQLLVELRSLSESGLVRLVAVAAVVQQDDQQYEIALPENSISIRGTEGKPLVAQKLSNKKREIGKRNATRFALGAIGRAAGLINRSRSESVVSNDGEFSRSTQNDDPDLLAGVLEGGTDAILDDIDKRNEEAIAAIEQRPDVLFLKAGTKVEVFVNSAAAVDVLEREQPILESHQPESEQFISSDNAALSPYLPESQQFVSSDNPTITSYQPESDQFAWLGTE